MLAPTLYESGMGLKLEEPEAITAPYKNVIGDQGQWVRVNESGEQAHGLNLSCQAECSGDFSQYISSSTTPAPETATPAPETARKLRVTKSIEFKNENHKYIKQYRTRGPKRGLMIMFSYSEFQTGPENRDIEGDCQMVKELFSELNFRVVTHPNLGKEKTLGVMRELSLTGYECVFIVVSSHGYERKGKWDTEFCCSDGGLIPVYEVVNIFNNVNYPELEGVPKVFIFQMCRGSKSSAPSAATEGAVVGAGGAGGAGGEQRARAARAKRIASDVLIAHSTLPGFEHVRKYDGAAGSLYMQALCEVFAAHAHAYHVVDLFRLLDSALRRRCPSATTVFENWGFGNLYLHPGLVEDADGNPTEV